MPTYDYLCENCGDEFEWFQSITAKPLRKCPSCGKTRLRRLIGRGSAIIFKGSGFYQTDYRSESYKSGEKNAKSKTDKPAAKEKTTSDTKSKSKSKSKPEATKDKKKT